MSIYASLRHHPTSTGMSLSSTICSPRVLMGIGVGDEAEMPYLDPHVRCEGVRIIVLIGWSIDIGALKQRRTLSHSDLGGIR